MKTSIKYMRFQNVNGRLVVFAQLFSEDGSKLFPLVPRHVVDAPLSQLLQHVEDEGLEVSNSQEILDTLVRKNGIAS